MKQDSQTEVRTRPGQAGDPHRSLHSETGALPGEHPGRSRNPLVKVVGLAWLEFEKPDLDRAGRFGTDFGFTIADRTPETLLLRGRQAAAACLVIRRGPRPRFAGVTFQAAARDDLDRLARGTGGTVAAHWGGHGVLLRDPSGFPVRVVHGVPELPALPERASLPLNFGSEPVRVNATQRSARRPAEIQRLGHVVLGTTRFGAALDWYLDTLGLIVSDFLYLDGQRDRGPAMAFIRCDLGSVPADHHTLAMALQPHTGYLHSAYELTDLDEVAASGQYLREQGYRHAWGLGLAHPGQPDLRLLARPGPGDVRALHRWRRVRRRDGTRLGPAVGQRPGPVGAEGDGGVHRRQGPADRRRGDQGPARGGQRDRPACAAWADQGDGLMSARLARTADGWWVVTPAGLVRLDLPATTTAGLLADRAALAAAIEAAQAAAAAAPRDAVPAESLDLLSPVTAPARIVAQAVNYRSHAIDSGFDPGTVPPVFFRKASHSLTGPAGDIIRPDGVGFLDYEVELGLVIGADLPVGTTVTGADLARYVAALVVADDVSARQIQLTKTQFYEAKSYPTFTPVGPWLTLVDAADLARLSSLRLTLSVNGQVRQDSTAADMIVHPAQALTLLSRFQPIGPGDLLLTGTPGGTALKAPAKLAGTIAGLLPPATRWRLFFKREAANPRYLRDGDVVTAMIASPDGQLDLGTQRNTVAGKAS